MRVATKTSARRLECVAALSLSRAEYSAAAAKDSNARARRRPTAHSHSDAKAGKRRFDLLEAMERDRERVERNRMLPWKEKFRQLQEYPWKFFIAFMVMWTWLGTYVVPYVKNMKPGELPLLRDGQQVPEDVREKAVAMPKFRHLTSERTP